MRRLLAVLALLPLAVAGGARAAVGAPSAEQLLAADVPWAAVQHVAGPSFWPEPPGFDTTVFQDDPQPKAAVSQMFDQIGGHTQILTRVLAFGSKPLAADYLVAAQVVGERVDQELPAVGERHAYYTTTLSDGSPSTRFFFTRGPLAALVQVDHASWSRAKIAQLASPIDAGLQQLLAGRLKAPALPAAQLALLPRGAAAPGPILGTALIPVEAWSTIVLKTPPRTVRARLAAAGLKTLPFRRYLLQGSRSNTVEATAFAFPSAAAAHAWFAPFAAAVKSGNDSLPPGVTGDRAAFRYSFGSYELQFVAGRYVGDIFCWAPFTSGASPACENATRALAEQWYHQLATTRA